MAWDHLSINKPHLVYIILGGFTSLFMLCSSVIKERLYIGEATVATLCGIIFGPHAAGLIDPMSWGNVDYITLEFSRIVLVVQCFAVGVELPKAYMERHWKSVTLLLIPVMTFGWLITSLFIWGLFHTHLNWLDSLCIAACVTATDPVLASSVVGKGKFAKRVPKHLRDLLSAESGCNDGMAFPFVYLALYLIRYRPDASKVAYHWVCYTILYECLFGAVYGVVIGYLARRAIRYAHEKDLIDRESFLVFYFVLALWCAGSGSLLGLDDLLVGFACGVGFSNDGWFLEKTEESHVSNVIDLLINLAFFVFFGAIIPWGQFNAYDIIGLSPWRLVVLGILVLLFRRIPIMLALKPIIPDIKTWREASFAGHFGPIGVGGLFVAILARAELETETTTPLAVLPEKGFEHLNIIEMIWPITCFLVIISIVVHGSSIAVFTLGKRINTLTISLSYTQAPEDGPSWMDRLPRIQSRSRSSMSAGRRYSESSADEKAETTGVDGLPIGYTGGFLRRQKEEDSGSRSNSIRPSNRKKRWDAGRSPGGPISQSAITPMKRDEEKGTPDREQSDAFADVNFTSSDSSSNGKEKEKRKVPEEEIYQEGDKTVFEDEEGNVLGIRESHNETQEERRARDKEKAKALMEKEDVQGGVAQKEHHSNAEKLPERAISGLEHPQRTWRQRMQSFSGHHPHEEEPAEPPKAHKPAQKRGPALAYQFGNTIIVEDEDGEVLKKYDIPAGAKKDTRPGAFRQQSMVETSSRAIQSLKRMGTHMGIPTTHHEEVSSSTPAADGKKKRTADEEDDDLLRFTVTAGGRRMSKMEFIQQMSQLDPKARAKFVQNSDAPDVVKHAAHQDAKDHTNAQRRQAASDSHNAPPVIGKDGEAEIQKIESPVAEKEGRLRGPEGLTLVDSDNEDVPFHSVNQDLANYSMSHSNETAAQRRRRQAAEGTGPMEQSPRDDDSDEETPAERRRRLAALQGSSSPPKAQGPSASARKQSQIEQEALEGETAAERKRRLGALGVGDDDSPESDSEGEETGDPLETGRGTHSRPAGHSKGSDQQQTLAPPRAPGIRFADQPRIPTKDERAAEDAKEKEQRATSKKSGLSKLLFKK